MADLQMPYGGFYVSTSGTTTNPTTPTKATVTTTAYPLEGFTHTTNRLTYTGTPTLHFRVSASVSASGSAADTLDIYIYKNGSTEVAAIQRKIPINDVGAGSLECIVQLATNDYVEIFFHVTGTANIDWDFGSMTAILAG